MLHNNRFLDSRYIFKEMASTRDEALLFVVEWFDPLPRLKRKYLLKLLVEQMQVEMVDLKSKKMFLKKFILMRKRDLLHF